MQRTIHLRVENKPGVLMRVLGIITAKGENIDFVLAKPDPESDNFALIELVAQVEPRLHLRVVNEMNRLVQVLEAVDVSERKEQTG